MPEDARPAPYWWNADKSEAQINREAEQRRIGREQAHHERGIPTAGHDNPAREAEAAAEGEQRKWEAIQNRTFDHLWTRGR